jgi:hypothetical protein
MMMTEMDIETSVQYVHLTRLIAREDFIKFTRRESTKTYTEAFEVHKLQRVEWENYYDGEFGTMTKPAIAA